MRALFIILLLSSCSANWHASKAIKKNPDVFKERIEVKKIDPVGTEIKLSEIKTGSKIVYLPTKDFDTVKVTVSVLLSHDDSLAIADLLNIEVDCPDAEIIEIPVPIDKKLGWRQKIDYAIFILFMIVIAGIIYRLFIKK